MKRYILTFFIAGLALTGLLMQSCSNSSDDIYERVYWKLYLNPQSQVPAVSSTAKATMAMQLLSDNTMSYSIKVSGLEANDTLTKAYMYAGDPLTNGPVILDFRSTFENGIAVGSMILRQSLSDSLMNLSNQLYVSVHSAQHPSGVIRGQVQTDVIFAADLEMLGSNQVPPMTTNAVGKTMIRITNDYKLFSNVSVSDLEAADALTAAHISVGAAGVNGDLVVNLCNSAEDFGVNKMVKLSYTQISTIRSEATHVNVLSTSHPTGLIRGQVVNGLTQNVSR